MKILYICLVLGYLTISCDSKVKMEENPKIEGDITVIKTINDFKQPDISTVLDTIKFIKLELEGESLIGNITKLIVFEKRIYIFDNITCSVFVFNMEGEYIYKISKIGRGPEEYTQLDFFDIDYEKRQIVLTDLIGNWILRYDLKGRYISRKKIPIWIEGLVPISNNGAVVYSNYRDNGRILNHEYNIIYLDSLMKVSKAYFPYCSSNFDSPKVKFSTPQSGSFYTFNDQRYFFSHYKNQVYQVTEMGIKPKYLFDFGENTFNEDYLNEKGKLETYLNEGDFYGLGRVLENNDFIIYLYYKSSFPISHFGYYSKKSGKSICGSGFTVGENNYFHGDNIATYDSWIIATISPDQLLTWRKKVDENKISITSEYLKLKKDIADQITLEDNQILMFYKLKEF